MHPSLSTTPTKSVPWAGGTASTSFPSFNTIATASGYPQSVRSNPETDISLSVTRVSNRIRLYSTKTFKPLGTLDYHKHGVQALTFARNAPPQSQIQGGGGDGDGFRSGVTPALVRQGGGDADDDEDEGFSSSEIEARKRWLVAGGKDGRTSVWELMDFAKPKP